MKPCQCHWDQMRAAIKTRGLFDLVATSGEEAVKQTMDDLKGVPKTIENYDPLMSLYRMITNRALECGGLYLMTTKEDGSDYCPLCEVVKHAKNSDTDTIWINGAADAIKAHVDTLPKGGPNEV